MAEGYIWNCSTEFPNCTLLIRSHFGEVVFHTLVQEFSTPSRAYCDWLGDVDAVDRFTERSSFRPGCGGANILLSSGTCRQHVCLLVHGMSSQLDLPRPSIV